MKKSFSGRFLLPFTFYLLPFLFTGCFEDEITFKGKVFWATVQYVDIDPTEEQSIQEILTVMGPVGNAIVKEASHSETATTNANGEYELTIEVNRVVGYPLAKEYRLSAWGSQLSPRGGADEAINMYVEARPGDTVNVRDFLLYEHTKEDYISK